MTKAFIELRYAALELTIRTNVTVVWKLGGVAIPFQLSWLANTVQYCHELLVGA